MPAVAQQTLTVYDGENVNSYVPVYGTWADAYNKCEFVMNAEELGDLPNGANILGLTWYLSTTPAAAWNGNFQVFIKEIDETTLSDFTGTEDATKVWEGPLDGTSGQVVLELTTPYTYGGGNLLIAVYQTQTGTYKTSAFYGVNTDGASVSGYSSSSLDAISATQRNFVPKTTFEYVPAGAVVYDKPKNLQVSDITPNGATITWEAGSTETAWNVEYKKTADEEWTDAGTVSEMTITLDALARNTDYDVRVRADHGEGQSAWVTTSFKTLKCEASEMGNITYSLTDSYGDGWNGNQIQVIDAATNEVVETLTITSGSSASGTIGICLGDSYIFNWISGSYGTECSFTITDPFGEVIIEHAAGTAPTAGELASYTYEIVENPRPTKFAVGEITQTSAVATWEGQAESYTLRYRTKADTEKFYKEDFENGLGGWTALDNDADGDNWALMKMTDYNMGGTPMTAADGDYALASCSVDADYNYIACDNWIISPQLDLKGTLKFFVSDLGADYVEHFSVYVSTTGTDVADFTALGENIATPGELNNWAAQSYDLSAYEGQQGYIAIRHQGSGTGGYYLFLDAVSLNGTDIPAGEWITVENATSPATMEGLTSNTTYEAQVQAVYGENTSDWTDVIEFTTLSMNVVPLDLEITEVTATTATAEWEGIQEGYNLRYREAAAPLNQINEDFETMTTGSNPPEGWTLIDADGDGYCWYGWAPSTINDNAGNPVVNGACGITSASYQSVALTPDNWLITPRVNLGGTVSFMYRGQDPSWAAEHFAVYVSTGDPTDTESFVQVGEETIAGATLAEFTADLSEYEGEVGYIAIRHFNCTDQFRLNIDDFVYNNNDEENVPAGEWTVVENVTSPYTIEGLNPETDYEAQIQGIYPDGAKAVTDWSGSVYFTTLEQEEVPEYSEFYIVGTFNEWSQAEDGGRIALVANDDETEFTGTVELEANAEFKIITPAETEGEWIWFGGEDANGVGYFLINSGLLDANISLVQGSNFRVEEGGSYDITIKANPAKGVAEPLVMVVSKTPTGINTVGVDGYNNNAWYNLNGQKLSGKPTVPGIYINGNKKVIIR